MLEFGIDEVLAGRAQPAGAATLVVDADVPAHTHAFIELAIVVAGDARHSSALGRRRVRRGDVVIVRPGSWHAYDQRHDLVVTNAYLRPGLVHRELAWLLDFPSLAAGLLRAGLSFAHVEEEALGRAVAWLDRLEADDRPQPIVPLGLITCALGELVGADFTGSTGTTRTLTPAVRHAMRVLQDRIDHPWTIGELAGLVAVSPSGLQRQFRQQVGQSPLEWLRQLRGERAATWLAQTDLPVAEIGRRIGWEDPNYMSRRFRLVYGVQPSQYRERFRAPRPGTELMR